MKRQYRRFPYLLPCVVAVLLLCQVLMGVNYSAWQDSTNVTRTVRTGSFELLFIDDSCEVYVINRNKPERALSLPLEVECEVNSQRNTVKLEISGEDLTGALLEPNRFLAIYYPIETTEESSVTHAAPREVDLRGEPDETVWMEDEQPVLFLNEEAYVLPGAMENISGAICFEAYHQVIVEEDRTLGVLYLTLSEESRDYLAEPKALTVDASEVTHEIVNALTLIGDGSTGILEGEIRTLYSCELPLYLEQGRGEAGTK